MAARDKIHSQVVRALQRAGWTITHDPLVLRWAERNLFVDLGAELVGAELADRRIAVEIKSFLGPSLVEDLTQALGQFSLYEDVLREIDPTRTLYLAVQQESYRDVFDVGRIGALPLEHGKVRLIVVDTMQEEVLQWIKR